MASVSTNEKSGTRRILFADAKGKRKQIRLGKIDKRQAESFKGYVEDLVSCEITGDALPRPVALWLAELDDKLRRKMERVGLIPATQTRGVVPKLGPFIDEYIAKREATGAANRSLINYTQARESLCDYFGADKRLVDITESDAKAWRRWMLTSKDARRNRKDKGGLLKNTANRRCGFARQFFTGAVDARLISKNPFSVLKGIAVKADRERDYFLPVADAEKVLAQYPDAEGRLIFALARYGGLRCPCEHSKLTWGDVDFAAGKLRIDSPKTGVRVIPIFPELRPYLDDALTLAGDPKPAEPIFKHRQGKAANYRSNLLRAIRKAGLKPWPKVFQNLRATRQTELAASFPIHVVCEWIGNSRVVAQEHYLRVTEADFAAATGDKKAAQKAAHSTSRRGSQAVASGTLSLQETSGNSVFAPRGEDSQYTPQESNL